MKAALKAATKNQQKFAKRAAALLLGDVQLSLELQTHGQTMIRRALKILRERLEIQRLKALRAQGKPIPFKFRNREYYLNAEEGAYYHIKNSTIKIAKMCDLVIRPPRVVFDVGANCGLFSAFISAKFPACHVFAFEPSAELLPIIKMNCATSNVTICNFAAGSENCDVKLFVNPLSQQTNSLKKESVEVFAGGGPVKELIVLCRTLDSVVEEFKITSVDVLKVDVQGFEGNVFRGARKLLRNVEYLFVESSWLDIESVVALVPFAIQYGFEYAAVVNPVHMGADIMFSRVPIPADSGAELLFPISNELMKAQWT